MNGTGKRIRPVEPGREQAEGRKIRKRRSPKRVEPRSCRRSLTPAPPGSHRPARCRAPTGRPRSHDALAGPIHSGGPPPRQPRRPRPTQAILPATVWPARTHVLQVAWGSFCGQTQAHPGPLRKGTGFTLTTTPDLDVSPQTPECAAEAGRAPRPAGSGGSRCSLQASLPFGH